ncbi:sugar phosphate isomerase/epimerase family protein [Agromyces aerolatus]|uniref:sugar phosphate isomerase/epimerase family protein n=1 Tax=Agromyces sp. LY-1074 TaxID=3074080 RepID=UPI0028552E88|nr:MULTISPECIES: sugar phosphate isomerase/epimerase [unclassified Agromyces]MDR5701890.1 sugar phosphate isomerase/epimerase [Agromyces sp. LY-1074]MDR5708096.1 sugar phosphate isomerase/epimerase [Agromyces sp. LY-1358]
MTSTAPAYGVDAITFYDPAFWGVASYDQILEIGQADPKRIWETIFDALGAAGVTHLELTFPPADWRSAVAAYGAAAAFGEVIRARGITLSGGFIMATEWGHGVTADQAVQDALPYVEFLQEVGGEVLVAGPPMRRTRDAQPPLFIDLEYASRFADVAHRVGDAALRRGVKLALHTEAHSMFCTRRDINLLLALTDPEYVFFCPDTAHIVLAGGDPVQIVADHLERVAIAHWKDAVGPMPAGIPIEGQAIHDEHRKYMTSLGAGAVDWAAWTELYDRSPAASVRLLELDAVPDPIAEMQKAVRRLSA